MITLAQELILLAIDDDGAISRAAGGPAFTIALIGACLSSLDTAGRIDVDLETVHVTSDEPTGNDVNDQILALLASQPEQSLEHWLATLQLNQDLIRSLVKSLVDSGVLAMEEKRFLWVRHSRRYPPVDGEEQKEARLRILGVLLADEVPTPHDSVLIGLARVSGLLNGFLSAQQLVDLGPRLDQVSNLDLIGQIVEKAIVREQEALAQAVLMAHP